MLVAEEGEKVSCENGHYICTVAERIETGRATVSQFKDWAPDIVIVQGERIPDCPTCGAPFIRRRPLIAGLPATAPVNRARGEQLHIEGRWR